MPVSEAKQVLLWIFRLLVMLLVTTVVNLATQSTDYLKCLIRETQIP